MTPTTRHLPALRILDTDPSSVADLITRRMDANPALRARGVVTRLRSGLMDLINQVLQSAIYRLNSDRRSQDEQMQQLAHEAEIADIEESTILEKQADEREAREQMERIGVKVDDLIPVPEEISKPTVRVEKKEKGKREAEEAIRIALADALLGLSYIEKHKGIGRVDEYLTRGDLVTPMRAGWQLRSDTIVSARDALVERNASGVHVNGKTPPLCGAATDILSEELHLSSTLSHARQLEPWYESFEAATDILDYAKSIGITQEVCRESGERDGLSSLYERIAACSHPRIGMAELAVFVRVFCERFGEEPESTFVIPKSLYPAFESSSVKRQSGDWEHEKQEYLLACQRVFGDDENAQLLCERYLSALMRIFSSPAKLPRSLTYLTPYEQKNYWRSTFPHPEILEEFTNMTPGGEWSTRRIEEDMQHTEIDFEQSDLGEGLKKQENILPRDPFADGVRAFDYKAETLINLQPHELIKVVSHYRNAEEWNSIILAEHDAPETLARLINALYETRDADSIILGYHLFILILSLEPSVYEDKISLANIFDQYDLYDPTNLEMVTDTSPAELLGQWHEAIINRDEEAANIATNDTVEMINKRHQTQTPPLYATWKHTVNHRIVTLVENLHHNALGDFFSFAKQRLESNGIYEPLVQTYENQCSTHLTPMAYKLKQWHPHFATPFTQRDGSYAGELLQTSPLAQRYKTLTLIKQQGILQTDQDFYRCLWFFHRANEDVTKILHMLLNEFTPQQVAPGLICLLMHIVNEEYMLMGHFERPRTTTPIRDTADVPHAMSAEEYELTRSLNHYDDTYRQAVAKKIGRNEVPPEPEILDVIRGGTVVLPLSLFLSKDGQSFECPKVWEDVDGMIKTMPRPLRAACHAYVTEHASQHTAELFPFYDLGQTEHNFMNFTTDDAFTEEDCAVLKHLSSHTGSHGLDAIIMKKGIKSPSGMRESLMIDFLDPDDGARLALALIGHTATDRPDDTIRTLDIESWPDKTSDFVPEPYAFLNSALARDEELRHFLWNALKRRSDNHSPDTPLQFYQTVERDNDDIALNPRPTDDKMDLYDQFKEGEKNLGDDLFDPAFEDDI